jgi:transmembrane sensor
MTYDPRIKLNGQISEEAAEWFIEFRTGDIDSAGRRAFDVWVRSSQEHLRAYLEVAAIWNECAALDAQRAWETDALISLADENVVPLPVSGANAPNSRQASSSGQELSATPKRPSGKSRVAAIAAAVTFLVCTLTWLQFYRLPTYATEVGEQRSIRLADGSTIELNSRSRVRIHFTERERGVELLEGQALFHVAKNPARPFIVRSGDTHVRAVGTLFDINKKPSGTIVTVVEGKVAVVPMNTTDHRATESSGDQLRLAPDASGQRVNLREVNDAILLAAGEQVVIIAERAVPKPIRVNTMAATAWTHRQLVLESVGLAEVAAEFNRYSTRNLVVEDSASQELRLSGVFETDPDFLIRYLRERPDITIRETDTEIRIIRHD